MFLLIKFLPKQILFKNLSTENHSIKKISIAKYSIKSIFYWMSFCTKQFYWLSFYWKVFYLNEFYWMSILQNRFYWMSFYWKVILLKIFLLSIGSPKLTIKIKIQLTELLSLTRTNLFLHFFTLFGSINKFTAISIGCWLKFWGRFK